MKDTAENDEALNVYVSITGLRINNIFQYPQFYWLAISSMMQARRSPGLIQVDARKINGVHHTLSIWEDESSMRKFLVTGAHLKAMQSFRTIATGKTVGFTTKKPPEWSKVHEIWIQDGLVV